MEEPELVVSEDEMCSLKKELAAVLSARLVEGRTLSKPLRALSPHQLISSPPCLALPPSHLPSASSLSSRVLSLPQQFLQALEPKEVISYFGPDATLEGTCAVSSRQGGFSEPA